MNVRTWLVCVILSLVCVAPLWGAEPAELKKAAAGGNALGMELYGKIRGQEGGLCLSPYSITSALAMTYAGARGETAEQMANVLHLEGDPGEAMAMLGELRESLLSPEEKENYTLAIANRLWGQSGFKYLDNYLEMTKQLWGAPLQTLDFMAKPEEARNTINAWVADETQKKIEELLPFGSIHRDTQLVLTNALYLRCRWATPFKENETADRPFHVTAERTVDVPTMHQVGQFGLRSRDGVQILHIPYYGFRLWMAIIIPDRIDGLADAERLLRVENLPAWKSTETRMLEVYLPRFKVSAQFDLVAVLKALGMSLPFTPQADFSGMTGRRDLMLSGVFHAGTIDTDEQGTEAAAATAVELMPTSAPPEDWKEIRVDRPFIFFIYDEMSEAILFLGRVVDPSGK